MTEGSARNQDFVYEFGMTEGSARNQVQIDYGQPATGRCEKLGPKWGGYYLFVTSYSETLRLSQVAGTQLHPNFLQDSVGLVNFTIVVHFLSLLQRLLPFSSESFVFQFAIQNINIIYTEM